MIIKFILNNMILMNFFITYYPSVHNEVLDIIITIYLLLSVTYITQNVDRYWPR